MNSLVLNAGCSVNSPGESFFLKKYQECLGHIPEQLNQNELERREPLGASNEQVGSKIMKPPGILKPFISAPLRNKKA